VAIDATAACAALLVRISGGSPHTKATLEEDGLWVTTCFDVAQARQRTHTLRPDLIIVEVDGQHPGDWDACQQLVHVASQPSLVLVRDASPQARLAAFASGADDVLAQPFEPLELVARARALLRRAPQTMSNPANLRHDDLELDLDAHVARLGNRQVALTVVEFRLLRALLEQPQRTFSREELLARVHNFDDRLPSERSIDLHVAELRTKLGDNGHAPRYIETVRGSGYCLSRSAAPARLSAAPSAPLADKVAFVVGSSGGGRLIARILAGAGARVVVGASGPDVERLAGELTRDGLQARAVPIDPGNPDQLRAAIAEAAEALGSVDILVWTVGAALDVELAELDDSTWQQMLRRGLGGALLASRETLPHMFQRGWGRIVVVTPQGATVAARTIGHGLLGLTRALAAETRHNGVTVNAVCPKSGGAGYEAIGEAVLLLVNDSGALSGQVLEID
jgi:DNA-binding response OmpR family regulator/NAD(P)-dependent dehydrogenase (short-subunit alcohol dehydrogenase family)